MSESTVNTPHVGKIAGELKLRPAQVHAAATLLAEGATVPFIARYRKEATGSLDSATEICQRCPEVALLSGDDTLTLPFASVGAIGVVSVVSNILPERVSGLCRAFLAGKWPEALAIHRELFEFSRAMFLETNPIPVKAALKMLGRDTGAIRLPMCEPTSATLAALRQALTAQHLI